MRENRPYGSEGGEAKSLPYPYRVECAVRALLPKIALDDFAGLPCGEDFCGLALGISMRMH
jgi:hypothetical protein